MFLDLERCKECKRNKNGFCCEEESGAMNNMVQIIHEQTIAKLIFERERKYYCRADATKDPIIMLLLLPDGSAQVIAEEELSELNFDFCGIESDFLGDDMLLVQYNENDVLQVDDKRYLMGAVLICEIDENGNSCSISEETIRNTYDYIDMNQVMVEFGDSSVVALRII